MFQIEIRKNRAKARKQFKGELKMSNWKVFYGIRKGNKILVWDILPQWNENFWWFSWLQEKDLKKKFYIPKIWANDESIYREISKGKSF